MRRAPAIALFFLAAAAPLPVDAESIVAARTIRARAVIDAGDVAVVRDRVAGAAVDISEVIGREARIAIFAGRAVRIDDLGPPTIVERNQIVRIVYVTGTLSIVAEGRSLARAGLGDSLVVMNLASRTTVSGIVAADGSVHVTALN